MNDEFRILSIDGGGLKGLFVASFLAALEETTEKSIADHFDLIAGTSTGGIIALGLGLGFSAREILSFYLDYGKSIFPAQSKLARGTRLLRQFFRVKYSGAALERALQEHFGVRRLGESSVRLVIPAYDTARGDVHIFKTPHHPCLRTDYVEHAWEVARATAAAPTYIPMHITDDGVRLIDGGIWASNPCMVAVVEAMRFLGQPASNIDLLSIGTTESASATSPRHVRGGLAAWARKSFEFMLSGQSAAALNQCIHILGKDRVVRINPTVPRGYQLDRLSDELRGIGRAEARQHVNEIADRFLHRKAPQYVPEYLIEAGIIPEKGER